MNVQAQTELPDRYQWWRAALKAVELGTFDDFVKLAPIVNEQPQAGRYRLRSKNKTTGNVTSRPVAYWFDDAGTLLCKLGDNLVDYVRACELWSSVAHRPISNEVYKNALATGEWPDVHPGAQADRSNSANALDENALETIKERVETLSRDAEKLIAKGGAKTKPDSDQAADLADQLRRLEVKAEARRKELHEPHKAEIKRLDGAWNPVRDMAESAKRRLKAIVVTPFLLSLEKAEDDRREQVLKTGTLDEAAALIDEPARKVAGTSGRVALRPVKKAIITDYPKALAYFAENTKVRELIQQLCDAAVRQGTTPDGCELETGKVAA